MSENKTIKDPKNQELLITRIFDAPRESVWKAWMDSDLVKRWWGPKGFTSPYCEIDFRVGRKFLSCMRSPEDKEYWSTGVYREIIPLKKIVCTNSFADEKGTVVPSTQDGMSADIQMEMLVTVTFGEHDGKTTLTLQHVGIPAGADRPMYIKKSNTNSISGTHTWDSPLSLIRTFCRNLPRDGNEDDSNDISYLDTCSHIDNKFRSYTFNAC